MKALKSLIFSYKGRVGRKQYLIYHICGLGGYFLLTYIYMSFKEAIFYEVGVNVQFLLNLGQMLLGALGLFMFYCAIPVSIKRCHDLNRAWWHYCLWSWLLPIGLNIAIILSAVAFRKSGRLVHLQGFGLLFVFDALYALAAFIALSAIPGTKGENKFGHPPK